MDRYPNPKEPLVGIWWDDGKTLTIFVHPPTENSTGKEWIDSNLSHWREWEHAALRYGMDRDSEYFVIPRGRAIWNPKSETGIIFHGSATDEKRLKVFAKAFGLPRWECRLDEHYTVGEAVDWLFDEDDEFWQIPFISRELILIYSAVDQTLAKTIVSSQLF